MQKIKRLLFPVLGMLAAIAWGCAMHSLVTQKNVLPHSSTRPATGPSVEMENTTAGMAVQTHASAELKTNFKTEVGGVTLNFTGNGGLLLALELGQFTIVVGFAFLWLRSRRTAAVAVDGLSKLMQTVEKVDATPVKQQFAHAIRDTVVEPLVNQLLKRVVNADSNQPGRPGGDGGT